MFIITYRSPTYASCLQSGSFAFYPDKNPTKLHNFHFMWTSGRFVTDLLLIIQSGEHEQCLHSCMCLWCLRLRNVCMTLPHYYYYHDDQWLQSTECLVFLFPLQPPKKDTKQSSSKPKDKPSGGGGKAKKKV